MKIEKVLVIADQQDKQQSALAHAKSLCKRTGAKLHIVAFHYENLTKFAAKLNQEQRDDIQNKIISSGNKWLKSEIALLNLQDDSSCEVLWEKDIVGWVKQHCESHAYDLIIKTGHRSEGLFYVPTDWHLIRNNLVPTLIVAEKKWRKKQTIMVSLDLGTHSTSKQELNQKLLDAGITFATNANMPLHICYSIPISPVLKDLGIIDKKTLVNDAKSRYLPIIETMLGDYDIPLANIHFKAGPAAKVIPSIASKCSAGLVVMGSIGRKGITAKIMGNTSESVLGLLKTDILVIQP
ncbi:universal stress protein [Paraglaciecola arctica]|uniref:universal stress protein n=1 Tax=Paraglaciecola arctica TaxID=1128911 RepID=UPI001C077EEB|nr:universal stress protein [Paraglaciecola arctica]MBU3002409.1 universal stress protein [Paraglaciecola arctica]